jgi:uncharacterized protein (DUF2235 family)
MRRLVVLIDGTGNGRGAALTNVEKLQDWIVPGPQQPEPLYLPGVGTNGRLDYVHGGAFGFGLSQQMQKAYRWLAREHQEGDEIFMFGFSRGAFAVQGLAGFIQWCGLLQGEAASELTVGRLFRRYSSASQHARESGDECAFSVEQLRCLPSHTLSSASSNLLETSRRVFVKFMGLWDAVRAAGREAFVPHWIGKNIGGTGTLALRYTRHVPPIVDNAYHALAIDEHRESFAPRVWVHPLASTQEATDVLVRSGRSEQTIRQRWFVGAHSNVGGGYAQDPLADCSLAWMHDQAARHGLVFGEAAKRNTVIRSLDIRDSWREHYFGQRTRGTWTNPPVVPFDYWHRPVCLREPASHGYYNGRIPVEEGFHPSVRELWRDDPGYRTAHPEFERAFTQ